MSVPEPMHARMQRRNAYARLTGHTNATRQLVSPSSSPSRHEILLAFHPPPATLGHPRPPLELTLHQTRK